MSDDSPLYAKVLTVSDGVFHGTRDDTGGRGLVEHLTANGFEVVDHQVSADGADAVAAKLVELCDEFAGLVRVTSAAVGSDDHDLRVGNRLAH